MTRTMTYSVYDKVNDMVKNNSRSVVLSAFLC